jgi:hypothetical protein
MAEMTDPGLCRIPHFQWDLQQRRFANWWQRLRWIDDIVFPGMGGIELPDSLYRNNPA